MHRYQIFAVIRHVTLVVFSVMSFTPIITAQDPLAPPAKVAKTEDANVDETPETPKQDEAVRKQEKRSTALFAALIAVAGIAVLGVGAIAMNMLWARRLRRLARDPGPRQTTVGNDFWFLKPPKPPVDPDDPSNRQPPPASETRE